MNSLNRKNLENGVADPVWIKDSARHFLLVSICVGGGFSILLLALVLFTALWHPAMLILSVVNGIALGGLTFLYRFLKQRMVHRVRRIAPERENEEPGGAEEQLSFSFDSDGNWNG
jgi:hypothetical protein